MKHLIAEKVKNGWYIQIIETHHLDSISDVYQLIKQSGMKANKDLVQTEDGSSDIIKIYAD